MRSGLRNYLGVTDEQGVWHPMKPDATLLAKTKEAHARGGILVAAVFSAFLAIYKRRSADLFRIATSGTGVFATAGDIPPDLVKRLAREAAAAAEHLLTMCIRGLDYCQPVDITFGDYLRAIITADTEVFPTDKYNYRIALIDAFRQWGIFPEGTISMSESALSHALFDDVLVDAETARLMGGFKAHKSKRKTRRVATADISPFEPEVSPTDLSLDWNLSTGRKKTWEKAQRNAAVIHAWLKQPTMTAHLTELGLTLDADAPPSVYRSADGLPSLEVNSVRTARRRGLRDELVTDLVVEVCQRRKGFFDPAVQTQFDAGNPEFRDRRRDFRFRRGCTLIIDPLQMRIRYAIRTKGNIADNEELDKVRRHVSRREVDNAFSAGPPSDHAGEFFAALHRHEARVPDFE